MKKHATALAIIFALVGCASQGCPKEERIKVGSTTISCLVDAIDCANRTGFGILECLKSKECILVHHKED